MWLLSRLTRNDSSSSFVCSFLSVYFHVLSRDFLPSLWIRPTVSFRVLFYTSYRAGRSVKFSPVCAQRLYSCESIIGSLLVRWIESTNRNSSAVLLGFIKITRTVESGLCTLPFLFQFFFFFVLVHFTCARVLSAKKRSTLRFLFGSSLFRG